MDKMQNWTVSNRKYMKFVFDLFFIGFVTYIFIRPIGFVQVWG